MHVHKYTLVPAVRCVTGVRTLVGARQNMSVAPAWKPDVVMLSEIWLGAMCAAVPAAGIKCVRSAKCVQRKRMPHITRPYTGHSVLRAKFLYGTRAA